MVSDNINTLLSADEKIGVKCEDRTKDSRFIDITVFFEKAKFAVGIENKIFARDQNKQVEDYCNELERRTQGNYKLLYLSPDGHTPSEASIEKNKLESLSDKIRIISYSDIAGLLLKYETVCRADNVRGFIRQFQQYIKQQYLGEAFMGENNFVSNYLRAHPEILKHADALRNEVESLKPECFNAFWNKVAEYLNSQAISIDLSRMTFCYSGHSEALVKHHGSPLEASGELRKVSVFYEPKIVPPVYIAIAMSSERKNLSQQLKSKVERFEEKLKEASLGEVRGNVGGWWCAPVPLSGIKFNDGNELYEILKDKDGGKIRDCAIEAAKQISKYIEVTESLWRELSIAEPKPPASPA